jgi:hypothetical protein
MECPRSSPSAGPTLVGEAVGPSSSTTGGNDVGHPHILPLPRAQPVVPQTRLREEERKQKWREPTRAAVNMSLHAEKEKTGGRRRLASDVGPVQNHVRGHPGGRLLPPAARQGFHGKVVHPAVRVQRGFEPRKGPVGMRDGPITSPSKDGSNLKIPNFNFTKQMFPD